MNEVKTPIKALEEKIVELSGTEKAGHYSAVILPQIFADFLKTLLAAECGKKLGEEYIMDDGSLKIILKGEKRKEGGREVPVITEADAVRM